MHAPTGEQFHISGVWGGQRTEATITAVAAGLRSLSVGGHHLTEPFAEHETPASANGAVLVPWPNRVDGGRWQLDGAPQQLDITEVGNGNAIHGLLRYTAYGQIDRSESSVTLAAKVFPQHGYPFLLDTRVRYEVGAEGLTVTHTIHNLSDAPAPVAVGCHPYLRVGDAPIEDLVLQINADTWFEADERQLPVAEHPVAGTEYDLSAGRRVGDLALDTTFGSLHREGRLSRHRLSAPNGRWTELWQDDHFVYAQAFTPTDFMRTDGTGSAVAVEPMTASPNAFNTGKGLRWLQPDERWALSWGVTHG